MLGSVLLTEVDHAGEVLDALIDAALRGEEVLLTRLGRPVVAIVPFDEPPAAVDRRGDRA
jgi:antitoxin (DNA-binding transcriptional repressor) of toxin-antitoxin stability system